MSEHVKVTKGALPSDAYDTLKPIATTWLPALATLYFTIGNIWGLPNVDLVVPTITAVNAFLGVVLGVSNHNYKKTDGPLDGAMVVDTSTPGLDRFNLELTTALNDLPNKDQIVLKVVKDELPRLPENTV